MDDVMEDNDIVSDDVNDESGDTVINDIDNNGYIVHDDEDTEPSNFFDKSARYSLTGNTFTELDDAYNFYNDYGLSKGFGIRKHLVGRKKNTNEIYKRMFVCNKQGFKDMNDKRRTSDVIRRCITRTGCKAMMQVTLSSLGEWVIDKFFDDHNHPLDPPSHVLKQRSHNIFHRSKECKDVVTLLSKAGMKSSQITKIVNAFRGNEEDKVTRVHCSNIVNNERKSNLGKECHGIIMHFQQKSVVDQDFYFAMDLGTDGTLGNLFWADGRSRSSYCQFGDVVVFDVTYKTNKFSLPFSPFVGVNHHGQTILLGAALLENETEITFTWLFKEFLKCMHGCPPISIITDQDLAMGKAIAKVFPKTRHRYCAWHIRKHVLEHLQPLRSRYDDFEDTFTQWVKCQNIKDFESEWENLKDKYNIGDDTWLGNMYKLRRYWVKVYLKDTFFAGMTTSGRSESIHSFFDGFVNSKTMLNEFVEQYDKAVASRRSAEVDQDFRTLNSKPTMHSDHPIEAMAAEIYTRNIYDIFKKEWKDSFDCGHEKVRKETNLVTYRVGYFKGNKENWKIVEHRVSSDFFATCSYAKFETFGLLCKHVLYIMRKKLVSIIPNHYILPRWTMKATHKLGNIVTKSGSTNDDVSKEVGFLTLWSVRATFNKVLENSRDSISEIEKIDDILTGILEDQNRRNKSSVELNTNFNSTMSITTKGDMPQHILVKDPTIPVKTKGRPKIATRIKYGIEVSNDLKKKRTCGYCGGKVG